MTSPSPAVVGQASLDGARQFLLALAGGLVPEVDRTGLVAVFERAPAGYAGPVGRDGRRVSAIAPSGIPFEVSITGRGGALEPALRYVTETATAMPFFGPRVRAQRAALAELVVHLPAPAQAAARARFDELVGALFPVAAGVPAGVPARTRLATSVGVVHAGADPGLAGLKLYSNLSVDPAAVGRLAALSPASTRCGPRPARRAASGPSR